ncbi:MAG TPA: VWA domain-containing protein [Candidatus Polarisedimenticolaceae bacterium]|nr:VWA domain-containing protein [Candidatus Polarisedimenticolaceae bacterium]
MRFAEPQLLWALLAVPAIAGLFALGAALRRRALAAFAGGAAQGERAGASVSAHRRAAKALCLLAAATAGILAAARPQWGQGTETISRKGIDAVIVLDTSLSMAAADVTPSRLARAVHEASTLIDRTEGDRVGLVTFAGAPALACPLTVDHEAVRLFLDAVDVEAVSVPGTALADAIREGIRALGPPPAEGSEAKGRALVVVSDGEDHEGGLEGIVDGLKRAGVVVYAIGTGTEQGAPIPTGPSGAYKKDAEGKLVTTRLDERPLRTLALDSGGKYYRATAAGGEVDEIASALAAMDATGAGTVLKTRWAERFQIPLAFALLALFAEVLISERRSS